MVIIFQKVVAQRIDILILPNSPLNTYLVRHVARLDLKDDRNNTCMVSFDDQYGWLGVPTFENDSNVGVNILRNTLIDARVLYGEEKPYRVPYDPTIMFRNFNEGINPNRTIPAPLNRGIPAGDASDKKILLINLINIKGRANSVIKALEGYKDFGPRDRSDIRNFFQNVDRNIYTSEYVWILKHVHPAIEN